MKGMKKTSLLKYSRSGGGKGGKIADDLPQDEPGSQTPGAPGTGTGTGGTMTDTCTGTEGVPVTGSSTVAKWERYIFIVNTSLNIMAWFHGSLPKCSCQFMINICFIIYCRTKSICNSTWMVCRAQQCMAKFLKNALGLFLLLWCHYWNAYI